MVVLGVDTMFPWPGYVVGWRDLSQSVLLGTAKSLISSCKKCAYALQLGWKGMCFNSPGC